MTPVLLISGTAAVTAFVVVMAVEGARRPGYDARYHTGSELELGERGWVMRTAFLVAALGLLAFAVGVRGALESAVAAVLLGIAAVGFLLAGTFTPDPVRGFPPGESTTHGASVTWQAKVHDLMGPVIFLALLGAGAVTAGELDGGWRVYTLGTVAVGVVLTGATITAYRHDSAITGLVQRGLVHTCLAWVAVLGVALAADLP